MSTPAELLAASPDRLGLATNHLTRRQALCRLGLSAFAVCGGTRVIGVPMTPPLEDRLATGALDEALRLLHSQEPESKQGLSTHAPMVAEALCALGFAERAVPWIREYNAPVRLLPKPGRPIDRNQWRTALGPSLGIASWEETNARWGDWKEFFTAELAENGWRDVLDVWLGRLAPGMSGAATHGVIRTAHAVRALAARETPERRGELARGLAYWASSYEELPAMTRPPGRFQNFADALEEVPLYWEAFGRTPGGRNIVEVLRHVRELESFAHVRDLLAQTADFPAAVSSLTATFARVYLRHGTQSDTIAFVHAVTGPCALRRIAPHVKPETAQAALPYAWQTAAALYSAYARNRNFRRAEESSLEPIELAAAAVKTQDEHAIKFTEVMLAEHEVHPDPVYLAAAADAIKRL